MTKTHIHFLWKAIVVTAVLFVSGGAASYAQKAAFADKPGPKNDIKIALLSLGSGSTRISYERAITDIHAVELTLGVVGAGFDILHHAHSLGGLVKAAYKWNALPQKSSPSPLAGLFLKGELIGAFFDYDNVAGGVKTRESTRQGAFLVETGYQLIVKWFVFDVYCGLGPSFGTGNKQNYFHGFMLFPKNGNLAFTAGFRLGVAF